MDGRLFDDGHYYDAGTAPNQPWNLAPGLDPAEVSDAELWDWGLVGDSPHTLDMTGPPADRIFAVEGWSS